MVAEGLSQAAPTAKGRFLRFALVGASGVAVNLGLLKLLVEGFAWAPLVASVVAIEASTLSNFLLNRAWTWRDRDRSWWSLLSYHGVSLVGMVTQWVVLWAGTRVIGEERYMLSASAGIAAATAWNFAANHLYTFANYSPERRRAVTRGVLYAGSFLLQVALAAVLTHDWDTFVFQKSVENFVVHGETPYVTAVQEPAYIFWGMSLPLQPMWYAYPPVPLLLMSLTYGPAMLGLAPDPWVARVLVKLPFILGNLALAWIGHRLVTTGPEPVAPHWGRRLEAFVLYNPLLVFVATIWGQFESLIVASLLVSLLLMRQHRWASAGVFWGLATLIKIFPLYLVPLLVVYAWRRSGFAAVVRYFAAGGAVFVGLSLPFFLNEPGGFIEQVFGMHAGRAPGRFAPVAFFFEMLRFLSRVFPGTLPDDEGLNRALSLLSFLLTAAILMLLTVASTRRPATEKNFLFFAGLSLLGGLIATKVVSEQYAVLPLAFLAIYRYHAGDQLHVPGRVRAVLWSTTVLMCTAALLDNAHFLVWLPEDVALRVLGQPVPEAILDLANFFGITVSVLRVTLGTAAILGLLVPLWFALRLLGPMLAEGLSTVAHAVHGVAARDVVRATFRTLLVVSVAIILLPPAAMGVLAPKRVADPDEGGVVGDRPLLIHYRTDWFNPTNRVDVAGGRWAEARHTPAVGYYNSMMHKFAADFAQLKSAGADGVVLRFDPAYEHPCASAGVAAADAGLPYALEVDLRRLADDGQRIGLSPTSAQHARELLNGPWFGFWGGAYTLRLSPDSGRLLFVSGVAAVGPAFTEAERRHVVEQVLPQVDPQAADGLHKRYGEDAWKHVPASADALQAPEAALWRDVYAEAERLWWTSAFDFGDASTRLHVLVDVEPPVDLSQYGPHRVVGRYMTDSPGTGDFLWLPADPAQPLELRRAWEDAEAGSAAGLLLPWNDFDRGQAIEPTQQFGDALLAETIRRLAVAP